MRQYTENGPGCSTAKYTNVGGRRQYSTQSWKSFLARWTVTNRIGSLTDRIGTVTGCIVTQTTIRLSWKIDHCRSLCSRRHTLFFGFSFPRNQNRYIFFEPCEVQTVFPFFQFSCEGSFFFGQSSKRLSADHLRCEHRRFYMVTSVGLVPYILADLGPRGVLLTKQTSFLFSRATLCATAARIALQNFTCLFSPATISLAKHTYVRDTRPFSNGTPPSQLRTN